MVVTVDGAFVLSTTIKVVFPWSKALEIKDLGQRILIVMGVFNGIIRGSIEWMVRAGIIGCGSEHRTIVFSQSSVTGPAKIDAMRSRQRTNLIGLSVGIERFLTVNVTFPPVSVTDILYLYSTNVPLVRFLRELCLVLRLGIAC